MFCGKCGSQISDGWKFCQKCGAPVAAVQGQRSRPASQQRQPTQQQPAQQAGGRSAGLFGGLFGGGNKGSKPRMPDSKALNLYSIIKTIIDFCRWRGWVVNIDLVPGLSNGTVTYYNPKGIKVSNYGEMTWGNNWSKLEDYGNILNVAPLFADDPESDEGKYLFVPIYDTDASIVEYIGYIAHQIRADYPDVDVKIGSQGRFLSLFL